MTMVGGVKDTARCNQAVIGGVGEGVTPHHVNPSLVTALAAGALPVYERFRLTTRPTHCKVQGITVVQVVIGEEEMLSEEAAAGRDELEAALLMATVLVP